MVQNGPSINLVLENIVIVQADYFKYLDSITNDRKSIKEIRSIVIQANHIFYNILYYILLFIIIIYYYIIIIIYYIIIYYILYEEITNINKYVHSY
jgi:hypothetical protein